MKKNYQICVRCVMDTSDPLIYFDKNGCCNHCTDYLLKRIKLINTTTVGSNSLNSLFAEIKIKGALSEYDCVVGVSGGVDSSYVAFLACDYGLRVLAVHMDNGWNSSVAVKNIEKLINNLDLSCSAYVLPVTEYYKVQLAFLHASVPEAETPTDIAIQRAVYETASKYKINYILSGGNIASEGILPKSWHYNARDTKYSHAILNYGNCDTKNFNSMRFGFADDLRARFIGKVKTVYPLNYIEYDSSEARQFLEEKYSWQYYGSKHGESKFTKFIQLYYLFVKHGIDYRRATFSCKICLNQMTRESALKELFNVPYEVDDIKDNIKYIANKLGIDVNDMDKIISAPPKWYFDYPNNDFLLGKAYDLYRYLTNKEKTSSF